jgi:CheY-like chemotaxis protein/HPt (histidine-containing phosphotransfer) domain-containing protein
METEWADSAEAALALAEARSFDVAIVGFEDEAAEVAAGLHSLAGGQMRMLLLKDVDAPTAAPDGTFACELTRPLKQARLYEAVTGQEAPAERSSPTLPPGVRVLVAEDNEVNRELLSRQLAKLGAQVEVVESGQAAVDAVRVHRYDVVLMDFHMPDVDGPHAARAIRAIAGERGSVAIVAVTGAGTADERAACLGAGMTEILQKPVTSGDLAAALARVLTPHTPAVEQAAIDRLDADLGDAAELRRIASIYIAQIEPGVEAVMAAADARDSEALRRSAHRLGSASATFGAVRLAELCSRLEALGADGRADASGGLARSLAAEGVAAANELRALLALGG